MISDPFRVFIDYLDSLGDAYSPMLTASYCRPENRRREVMKKNGSSVKMFSVNISVTVSELEKDTNFICKQFRASNENAIVAVAEAIYNLKKYIENGTGNS